MKKLIYLLPFVLFACSDEQVVNPGEETQNPGEPTTSELATLKLASFAGNDSRVNYVVQSRDGEEATPLKAGELRLVAGIDNPSKAEGFNFVKENGGRWMSASSVFYNEATGKYYVTYHMQGNNYNTTLDNEIGGAIQEFTIDEKGLPTLGEGFRAADPNKEDFDFNHLFVDKKDNRLVVVGHKWSLPKTWTSDEPYTGKRENTRAIIGAFNPQEGTVKYNTIGTSIEVRDGANMLVDFEDAADGNAVIRVYDNYFLATRKGIAVLHADEANLFKPELNEDSTRYFVPTPGSCKFVYDIPGSYTRMGFLYLSEDKENSSYNQSSKAKLATFEVATNGSQNSFLGFINPETSARQTFFNSPELDIVNYDYQFDLPEEISPIDGKNTLSVIDNDEYYAALGKAGLYYKYRDYTTRQWMEGTMTFGENGASPVNFVYAEDSQFENGHSGYVYVGHGATMTILDRRTLKEVASYTLSAKDGVNENEASANYIHVALAPAEMENYSLRERTVTVAFGQAGVKVFKFMPIKSSEL